MVDERLITPRKKAGEEELNASIRPQTLADFVGQKQLCQNYQFTCALLYIAKKWL